MAISFRTIAMLLLGALVFAGAAYSVLTISDADMREIAQRNERLGQ